MVQEFYVLKCHSCELFQVHIVKKVKKWNCKVCGVKQSVVRVFSQGAAKDCRIHVQKLNEHHCQNAQNMNENVEESASSLEIGNAVNTYYDDRSLKDANEDCNLEVERRKLSNSKWQKYLESDETNELSNVENAVNTYDEHSLKNANENCNLEAKVQRKKLPNCKWQKYLESDPDETNELPEDSLKFGPSHPSSSFVQRSELDEPEFKKLRLSRDYTEVKKNPHLDENINTENINSNSKKMFQFLSDDELSAIDDILEV